MAMNDAGQTDLATLQRKLALAETMAYGPRQQYHGPVGEALGGLARILAARNATKLTGQVDAAQTAQNQADLSALSTLLAGGNADLSSISDPRYQALAVQLLADRNKPATPVALQRGAVLVDPTTGQEIARGAEPAPNLMATGVPGLLLDRSTMGLVDILSNPNQANPMGVNVDAPPQSGSPPPAPAAPAPTDPAATLGGFRETPEQKRRRDLQAEADRQQMTREQKLAAKREQARQDAIAAQPEMERQNDLFLQTITDPAFEGAVGPVDQVTGRVGAMFGSQEGVLGERVDRLVSGLILTAASSLKGALSDKDIQFLERNAPGRGSSASVWRDWYSTEYLPRINAARRSVGIDPLPNPFSEKAQPKGKETVNINGVDVEVSD